MTKGGITGGSLETYPGQNLPRGNTAVAGSAIMEDEDGESKIMDMWSILGEQQLKDPSIGNTLKHSIDSVYADVIEDEKQLLRYNSLSTKDSPTKNNSPGSKIVFKGFKKRILAQAQETQTIVSKNVPQEQQVVHSNVSPKNNKDKRTETKRGKITEYAQYLGLQPSAKYKCSKCHSSTNLCSSLKQNQCMCNSNMAPMPSTSESTPVPHAANFKITRKVYLCAACGTYFENWNLFLHMRDIHKRHICLFCLGMFGQAERLSYHLSKKHSVPEVAFTSVEDFYAIFKGSCYLVCCTCERIFSETDNFYNHFCSPTSKQEVTASICTLCRQTGSHASTCSLAIETAKESNSISPINTVTQTGTVTSSHMPDRPILGNKTTSRKMIKNNRSKYGDETTPNTLQQKPNTLTRKPSAKIITSRSNEAPSNSETIVTDVTFQEELAHNSIRDTVSETIMEVSRYMEDSCEENEERKRMVTVQELPESTAPIECATNYREPYDSVTETIMEVSRCTNNVENLGATIKREDLISSNIVNDVDKSDTISEDTCKSDLDTSTPIKETEARLDESSSAEQESEEQTVENNNVDIACDPRTDSGSQGSKSPCPSPVNRSLFSPQHEPSPSDQKEDYNDKVEEPFVSTESQSSVSFNAVASSERSLVIKICTNRSSQFSVSTGGAALESEENHDVSVESEENNNAEGSASEEKVSNPSEKEKDSVSSYRGNEGDSDSDSDKLAVVDSNPEEVEEVEDQEEIEEVEETERNEENEGTTSMGLENNPKTKDGCQNIEEIGEERTMDLETNGQEGDANEEHNGVPEEKQNEGTEEKPQQTDGIVLAGEDVPSVDLNVEGTLESMEIEDLLKRCIDTASPFCVYCNHARHIAVNGKQLGLHMLAEHKFQPQHPAIIIQAEQFTARVKKSLDELEFCYFNLSTYSSTNGTYNIPDVRTYECFHCRFHSAVHKELYLHNRKMHQKTILICIMCKSTFYSYSELLCHLCPGTYSPNINVRYRCCLCPVASLPSAFRLMVHLRKRHHACDVCLESTGNQQRLSNHVWKHKLHHLCYRCGIAYRNKPDITKHLFWKHGTESVLCKKCLQKKWPHIYHFCIPPTAFVCEECGSSFSRAVALKVHKRLHSGDRPYGCNECTERFISHKLLVKHENSHREVPVTDVNVTDTADPQSTIEDEGYNKERGASTDNTMIAIEPTRDAKDTVKKVVDVYDLPPLNLSSESDTDSEEEKVEIKNSVEGTEKEKPQEGNNSTLSPSENSPEKSTSPAPINDSIVEVEQNEEEKKQEAQIMDGIWDNFKSYTASLEMKESTSNGVTVKENEPETDVAYLRSIVLADHDYCVVWSEKGEACTKEEVTTKECTNEDDYTAKLQRSPSGGSAIQNAVEPDTAKKKAAKSPKKKKQSGSTSSSDSSSDSDSSSCSCGTNCSCSSSSSGSSSSSSSSSDSDSSASESSPRKQPSRKERKREKEAAQEREEVSAESKELQVENGGTPSLSVEPACPPQLLLRESDLETEETDTDEDFYDEHPQQLANKLLAEKRNQLLLLAAVAPASAESSLPQNNGITETDSAVPSPEPISISTEDHQQKKKVKTKKRKKGERAKQRNAATPTVESIKLNIPKAFYQKNPGFSASSPSVVLHHSRSSTPNLSTNDVHVNPGTTEIQGNMGHSVGGSGSETDNKRSSKRKRVPKRFYGDSSDEDTDKQQQQHQQPPMKWRKVETFLPQANAKLVVQPRLSFGGKTVAYRPPIENQTETGIGAAAAATGATSATESEEPVESSSESSDSEVESSTGQAQTAHLPEATVATAAAAPVPERTVNLYCYCQCPYDEVSEMIACDGEDCRIEWFHFECVGIMVPPKGKWYCPDCRKKHGIVQNSEDYFD
ncbi:hypothetical protein KM043_015144 [Ampulex compressa]|nr:hypothetical protein KM043_015144 [Ampulex compressa]